MKEQMAIHSYARALYSLSEKAKFDAPQELATLMEMIRHCGPLEKLFFLDIFTNQEKQSVFSEIAKKISLNKTVKRFIEFLFTHRRIALLPFIYKEILVLDGQKKGVLKGVLEGSEKKIPRDAQEKIRKALKKRLNENVELHYKQTEKITAGYRITVDDLMLDVSLEHQLNRLRESVLDSYS